jgi:hypothetical protein
VSQGVGEGLAAGAAPAASVSAVDAAAFFSGGAPRYGSSEASPVDSVQGKGRSEVGHPQERKEKLGGAREDSTLGRHLAVTASRTRPPRRAKERERAALENSGGIWGGEGVL